MVRMSLPSKHFTNYLERLRQQHYWNTVGSGHTSSYPAIRRAKREERMVDTPNLVVRKFPDPFTEERIKQEEAHQRRNQELDHLDREFRGLEIAIENVNEITKKVKNRLVNYLNENRELKEED